MSPTEPHASRSANAPATTVGGDRFELLVRSVRDYAIFMLDREGRVQTWNAGAENFKGWRAEEIIGRSFETFYTAEAIASGWPKTELRLATERGRSRTRAGACARTARSSGPTW